MTTPTLFSSLRAGDLHLQNRIVMAPLTRCRAGSTHVPNESMVTYYSQRASAGLVMTEAAMVAHDGCAFISEGGIFDDACTAGWRKVTDAVHGQGGLVIIQLWHPGRATHSALNGGVQPVSSTDRAIQDTIRTPDGKQPYEKPRRLDRDEIPAIVELFRSAARRSKAAGFDGVQIHGAHGYLLDQFLRDGVNDRTDDYGGSISNRARLLLETVDAAIEVFGPGGVSVRISPLVLWNDTVDSNPEELVRHVAAELDRRQIAFFEIRHEDHRAPDEQALARIARKYFSGALFLNGAYDLDSARAAVAGGAADAVVFGLPFVSNPDLVKRFASGAQLNTVKPGTLYTPGPVGYTDYPSLNVRS